MHQQLVEIDPFNYLDLRAGLDGSANKSQLIWTKALFNPLDRVFIVTRCGGADKKQIPERATTAFSFEKAPQMINDEYYDIDSILAEHSARTEFLYAQHKNNFGNRF